MSIERIIERVLFASRWLLVPLYLGLALLLVIFSISFFRELFHIAENALSLRETDIILGALSLIDLVLVSGLIVMVMLSGYENFVSRLDIVATEKTISWLGKLDSGSLKLKVAASIVAIAAIQLLRVFMEIQSVPDDKLLWMTIIYVVFVAAALALAVMDRLVREGHGS